MRAPYAVRKHKPNTLSVPFMWRQLPGHQGTTCSVKGGLAAHCKGFAVALAATSTSKWFCCACLIRAHPPTCSQCGASDSLSYAHAEAFVSAFAMGAGVSSPTATTPMCMECPETQCAHGRAFVPAFAMGFGTSSSAATMPMTMECASKYGCRDSLVKFVIPLGTNINRDGAALYEASSVIFIAQAR